MLKINDCQTARRGPLEIWCDTFKVKTGTGGMSVCVCLWVSNLSSPPPAADKEFNFLLNGGEIGRDFVLFKHSWSLRSLGTGEQ